MSHLTEEAYEAEVDKMVTEFFPPQVMMWLDEPVQEKIRSAISLAYWNGHVNSMREVFRDQLAKKQEARAVSTPMSAVTKAIEADAACFERQFAPRLLEREINTAYPWGWSYVSPKMQQQFREFCRNRKPH